MVATSAKCECCQHERARGSIPSSRRQYIKISQKAEGLSGDEIDERGKTSLGAVLGRSPGWLSPSVRVHLLRDLGVSNWAYVSCECLVINYRVRKPRVVTDPRLASRRGIACERAGVTLSWP